MFRRLVAPALVAAATLGAGCGRAKGVSDQDLGELVVAPKTNVAPIQVQTAATDASELSRALAQPLAKVLAGIGPHTVTITTHTTVEEAGAPVSDLADETTIQLGEMGTFHAVYTNTGDYGREVIFVGHKLYLRPRYQKWHGRAPEVPNEPMEQVDAYFEPIAATWDLLAPATELIDKGEITVAGRTGRKIQIARAPEPAVNPAEKLTQRKWREQRVIEQVAGEVVLDQGKGVPLAVNLTGTISFMRDGRRFEMKVKLASEVQALGAVAITAPASDEVVATPERQREVDDRDELLQGIAPPTRNPTSGALPPSAESSAAPAPGVTK